MFCRGSLQYSCSLLLCLEEPARQQVTQSAVPCTAARLGQAAAMLQTSIEDVVRRRLAVWCCCDVTHNNQAAT